VLAWSGGVVEGTRVFDGFDMREDGAVRQCGADVGFDPLEQFVSVLDRPTAGNEHVHGDEGAASRLAVANRMEADTLVAVRGEGGIECRLLAGGESVVHQAAAGAADELDAGEDDVGGDGERDQRVEPLPAGQRDDCDAGDHADGRPDVGEQVAPVGLDGDRAMATPCAHERQPDEQVDDRRGGREIARPTLTSSSGRGWRRRWTATQAIDAAATTIRLPSTPADMYSAFSWP
jgi:hypothetical protein